MAVKWWDAGGPGVLAGLVLLLPVVRADWSGNLPGQLEASMQSSVLSDLQGPSLPLAGFSDSSAVVGQVFLMTVPKEAGDQLEVTEVGEHTPPSWLHWDAGSSTLQGLPLEGDKGVHYISVSTRRGANVFSIHVRPEEDMEPVQLSPVADASQPFACSLDEPVTVLTVILDADLTKMSPKQRVDLLVNMKKFSKVGLQYMRVLPVVNNRLFDMSAFMAGPGNAKKVVENGALLSWKLGCALESASMPEISSIQTPAKEGTMSAQLGYPVVGWHVTNKKPHIPKRVKRQLNTQTPVPSLLPPTTYLEPAIRIVPTPSSPLIAPTTDHSAPPVWGPMPLPVKPTIRFRDPIAHTPTLSPLQPTPILDSTSTIPVQPTVTRPVYVEATASPTPATPATRRPRPSTTRKPKKPKAVTTVLPREPKTTTSKTASPDAGNEKPSLHNPIDKVTAWVGTYFEVKIPSDTFYDKEDGTTDKLRLTLRLSHNEVVGESSWIQFNTTSQLLYGMPDWQHVGKHVYFMQALDKGGMSISDAFEVHVNQWSSADKPPVLFVARLQGEPQAVISSIHKKILLVKKLAYAFGDRNSSTVTLKNITKGSIVVEWTNSSLPQSPCPREQVQTMSRRISDPQGRPSPVFNSAMEPDFRPINISVRGMGSCRRYSFVPMGEVATPEPPDITATMGTGYQSTDDVYLHTVIPAVVVAAILLVAGIVAMICYRKKRKGKLTIEDQATFIKKGVPIIFADELDDSKPPPSSSMPLILHEEKPPLPPPDYHNMANPETTPLNQDLMGEYTALRDEDPNAPPYQPPPPFVTPMEGKGFRPRNMTPYRSPPPYVPP